MCRKLYIDNYVIETPLIDILKDVRLKSNGKLSSILQRGDELTITCPFHANGKEKRPSCGVYIGDNSSTQYGVYNCFTCGSKGPFYRLVAGCLSCSDDVAKAWLKDNYGTITDEVAIELEPIILKNSHVKKSLQDNGVYESYHPYMTKRKLSRDICKLFDVKYDSITESIVFPVNDEHGNFVMNTRRSVKNKTFIIDKNVEKPVYLLDKIIKDNISEVVVCESQINALYMWSLGYPSIATFGCNITEKQFKILNRSGIKHYILGFDGDDAGKHGIEKFLKYINQSSFVDVLDIPNGKDLNDLSKEDVDKLMKSYYNNM